MIAKIARTTSRAADLFAALALAAILAIFSFKIVRRYFFADAVAWADEVSVVLFIWLVFISNSFAVSAKQQIRFDLLHRALSPAGKRAIEIMRMALIGGIFVAAAPGATDYILFLWREKTPVMSWRLDRVYFCFSIFMASIILRYGWSLIGAMRRGAHSAKSMAP